MATSVQVPMTARIFLRIRYRNQVVLERDCQEPSVTPAFFSFMLLNEL